MTTTIALIEDDQWLGDSYERVLKAEGFNVIRAAEAATAIDLIDSHMPQLVVLDMLLTKTTAMALLHELQSHKDLAAIPVVMVSSIAERLDAEQLKAYGVYTLLDKETVTPKEMMRAVRGALV